MNLLQVARFKSTRYLAKRLEKLAIHRHYDPEIAQISSIAEMTEVCHSVARRDLKGTKEYAQNKLANLYWPPVGHGDIIPLPKKHIEYNSHGFFKFRRDFSTRLIKLV